MGTSKPRKTARNNAAPQNKKATEMTSKVSQAPQDAEEKIESALGRTEQFLYDNGKILLSVLGVIVIIVAGFLSYKHLYLASRGEKAADAMYVAEQQFAASDFATALNGDGGNAGFLEIASKYKATAQGNIAKHYAGICYLKLGELDNALKFLSGYKHVKGAPGAIINAQNTGLQGDIHVQKKEYEKAAGCYKSAIEAGENSVTAPYYMKKLAFVYRELGRGGDAVATFQRIVDEYPNCMESAAAEKYIGQQQQL